MTRIVIICKLNAARSVLIAAALKRRFPQFKFTSCGVEATSGHELPRETLQTAATWGLELENLYSLNIENIFPPLDKNDKIIVVEDFMKNDRRLLLIDPQNIYTFSNLKLKAIEIPRDPLGYGLTRFRLEIAKGVFFASRLIMELIEPDSIDTNLQLILSPEPTQDSIENVLRYCSVSQSNIIFLNFMTPTELFHKKIFALQSFLGFGDDGRFFEKNPFSIGVAKPVVYQAEFEVDYSGRFVLRAEFIDSIRNLASQNPLVLLCEVASPVPRIAEIQWLMASQLNSNLKQIEVFSQT